jgi:hypothetical protein
MNACPSYPTGIRRRGMILPLGVMLTFLARLEMRAQEARSTTLSGFADVYHAYSMLSPPPRRCSGGSRPGSCMQRSPRALPMEAHPGDRSFGCPLGGPVGYEQDTE